MITYNYVPYCDRFTRRKVARYQKAHPGLTFTQAYNKLYYTNFEEPKEHLNTEDLSNNRKK